MTSNQIAYASQLESQRHNQAYEEETKRHNLATEQLAQEGNDIQKEKNIITATYNQQMADIQSEYNKWYARFSEASTKRKLDLEAEGTKIKQQLADTQEAYNIRMGDLREQELSITRRANQEVKRHNVAVELQTQAIASMDWWFRDLELAEKRRANTITDEHYRNVDLNTTRGQDLTFAGNLVASMAKTGFDLAVPGFKIGVKGTMGTGVDLFNELVGGIYGSKNKRKSIPEEGSYTEGRGKEAFTTPQLPEERRDNAGQGHSVPGRLR